MIKECILKINNISKKYQIYTKPSDKLKEIITRNINHKEFWALKDVSFVLKKGECFGIIGKNGSGKSTLLKIIAGTLKRTSGEICTDKKIAALLELGSGFNPDFTGRENIYLSGSLYGISKKEMDKRYKEIVDFADIGEFINQPVKTYSSGMYSRLAFAVNINVSAEILIIDEILSVGDHFFQAKCMSAINKLMLEGVSILLVSHSQAQILSLCDRALLLDRGKAIACGKADMVVDKYMALCLTKEKQKQRKNAMNSVKGITQNLLNTSSYTSKLLPPFEKRITERLGDGRASYKECVLINSNEECYTLKTGDNCEIIAWLKVNKDIDSSSEIGLTVRTMEGIDLFAINSFFIKESINPMKAGQTIKCKFKFANRLGPGKYSVALGMRSPVQGEYVEKVYNCCIFDVVNASSRVVPLLFDVPGNIETELCNE